MAPPIHAVIFWEDENKYSTVSTKTISGFHKETPDDLVGQRVKLLWGDQLCEAQLLQVGTKANMKRHENELSKLAAETSFAERELLEAGSSTPFDDGHLSVEQDQASSISDDVNESENLDETNDALKNQPVTLNVLTNFSGSPLQDVVNDDLTVEELRAELAKTQAKVKEKEFENHRLKRALKKSSIRVDSDSILEGIGGNINLSKSFLDFLKLSYLGNPSIFLRRLVFDSQLFTLDEIAASSISGRKCPMTSGAAKPPLDPIRLKIIKDYTIAACGVQPGSIEMQKLVNSIRQIPSDARKKLNKTKKAKLAM